MNANFWDELRNMCGSFLNLYFEDYHYLHNFDIVRVVSMVVILLIVMHHSGLLREVLSPSTRPVRLNK